MQTPLVDAEGFPRADMDIYAVRNARVRIIELRNDLKDITDAIGKALEGIYDPAKAIPASAEPPPPKPFAKVNTVAPGSPAKEAGLQANDLILKFGHIDYNATRGGLQPIAELVNANENKHVVIKALRAEQVVHLTLTPRSGWGGRGLLGCHIVPYSA